MQQRRNAAVLVALIAIALYGVVGPRFPARAAIGAGCRTDPIFYFSNGDNPSLTMVMGVRPHEIKEIVYELQAPANTRLERVVVTGPVERDGPAPAASADFMVFLPLAADPEESASPRYVERWTVVNDQPPGAYAARAVVYTWGSSVPVTFEMRLREHKESVNGASEQWVKWLELRVQP